MKTLLILSACVLFIFSSCKKKTDVLPAAANTISATVDGVNMNFNVNASARVVGDFEGTGNIDLVIQGFTATGLPSNSMGISLITANTSSIINGTYTAASANNAPPIWAALSYTSQDPASNPIVQNFVTSNIAFPLSITITSISKTNVQGTFSGVMTDLNNGSNTKTVTSGKFNVNISN
jgi:hypothetical protein